MSLQISSVWALIVTLGAAEWFINSVVFFHGSSNDPEVCICNDTECSRLVSHQCFFMNLQVTQMFASVITMKAAEWFVTSVGSLMSLQIPFVWSLVVTLGAAEWFITCVSFFIVPQMTQLFLLVITLGASGWFINSVLYFFMHLHTTWWSPSEVILGAAGWFITSVDSLMCLQIIYGCTFVVTVGADEWFLTSMGSLMSFEMICLWAFVVTLGTAECTRVFHNPC